MRIALVSPYSHSYPGGVTNHVEALRSEFTRTGHETRVLAPHDPDDRLARLMHRGVAPDPRPLPPHVVPLGRTWALGSNGSTANLPMSTSSFAALQRELRRGRYDVVHVHEPHAPVVSWLASEYPRAPLVSTFHCYSTDALLNNIGVATGARRLYGKARVRIAVSEAARWTSERFYGGRYRVIPNGVDLSAALPGRPAASEELALLFIGRAEERKGLPVLLRAFASLRASGVRTRLTVVGADADEVRPLLLDPDGVELRGRVSEGEKWRLLHDADLLCAPSLGGESFGMVLTEAFAAGTPVVCSDLAGYREVVRDGRHGTLVAPGRADDLARALAALAADPGARERMGEAARERARRFAWPTVAAEVLEAYEEAIAVSAPERRRDRFAVAAGIKPADGLPRIPAAPLPPLDPPDPRARRRRVARRARRVGLAVGGAGVLGLAVVALGRVGIGSVTGALLAAAPVWVLGAFALMCAAMLLRAEAWHAILRAALPDERIARADVARATMIGVLMSATLPARLGEPARALVVARALGRVRERLAVVLGTVVSQTLLNLLATAVLGVIMFATVGLFRGGEGRLLLLTLAPVVLGALVLGAPVLVNGRGVPGSARLRAAVSSARRAMFEARRGLVVFRHVRLGSWATFNQLGAWVLQWLACWALLAALGLDGRAGAAAAAAVLFAVNVTAILPVTPSNVGVYQAACVAVLGAYGIGYAEALAYGIILQGLELATAVALGAPALVREGMSWRDMRARTLHAAPVELRSSSSRTAGA